MHIPRILLVSATAGACFLAVAGAEAASVVLQASKDNSMFGSGNPDGSPNNSDGQGIGLYVGNSGTSGLRRALIEFDVAAAIPPGSIITGFTLALTLTKAPPIFGPDNVTISLFKLTQDWGEGASNAPDPGGGGVPAQPGDATWRSNFHGSSFWTDPGGTFASVASGSKTVGRLGGTNHTDPVIHKWFNSTNPKMLEDVQSWLDNPGSNFGWILIGDETTDYTGRRFGSGESGVDTRPTLTILYTPAPEPATMGLLLSAGAVLASRRGRRGKSAHERI